MLDQTGGVSTSRRETTLGLCILHAIGTADVGDIRNLFQLIAVMRHLATSVCCSGERSMVSLNAVSAPEHEQQAISGRHRKMLLAVGRRASGGL